jgi:hypothetical protein
MAWAASYDKFSAALPLFISYLPCIPNRFTNICESIIYINDSLYFQDSALTTGPEMKKQDKRISYLTCSTESRQENKKQDELIGPLSFLA